MLNQVRHKSFVVYFVINFLFFLFRSHSKKSLKFLEGLNWSRLISLISWFDTFFRDKTKKNDVVMSTKKKTQRTQFILLLLLIIDLIWSFDFRDKVFFSFCIFSASIVFIFYVYIVFIYMLISNGAYIDPYLVVIVVVFPKN